MLFGIIGPSGSGKSCIEAAIVKQGLAVPIVSSTTRKMRDGEVHGRDYHFLTIEGFEQMIANDMFTEHAKYGDHYYGVQTQHLWHVLDGPRDGIIVLDVQGCKTYAETFNGLFKTILLQSDAKSLVANMRKRGDDDENIIKRLIHLIDSEENKNQAYADLVLNDVDLSVLTDKVAAYIKSWGPSNGSTFAGPQGE